MEQNKPASSNKKAVWLYYCGIKIDNFLQTELYCSHKVLNNMAKIMLSNSFLVNWIFRLNYRIPKPLFTLGTDVKVLVLLYLLKSCQLLRSQKSSHDDELFLWYG